MLYYAHRKNRFALWIFISSETEMMFTRPAHAASARMQYADNPA